MGSQELLGKSLASCDKHILVDMEFEPGTRLCVAVSTPFAANTQTAVPHAFRATGIRRLLACRRLGAHTR